MIDLTTPIEQIEHLAQSLAPSLADKQVIMLFNKSDLLSPEEIQSRLRIFQIWKPNDCRFRPKKTSILTDYNNYWWIAANFPEIGEHDDYCYQSAPLPKPWKRSNSYSSRYRRSQFGDYRRFLSQDIRECMFYLGELRAKSLPTRF